MRRLPVIAGLVVVLLTSVATPVSLARFTRSKDATGDFGTATLAPPTSLAASVAGTVVTLTWTPSTSASASGYDVLRSATSGSGYGSIGSVTPVGATTTNDSPGTGTFFYVLRTVLQNWRSANSNEASASLGSTGTGLKGCASNQAEAGQGDGNGYETSPGNACASDGALAADANSGTTTTTSCTDAGKDKHRFWGYAFGLPGSVTSINGVTVQIRAKVSNNGGTSNLCAQLSWDGGSSWTAAQSVALNNSLTTYTLGGATDTWGRGSWSLADLATGNFRLRIIDVSDQNNRDFSLDFAGVQVFYTP